MDKTIRNAAGWVLMMGCIAAGGKVPPAIADTPTPDSPDSASAVDELPGSPVIAAGQELAALQQIPLFERLPEQQRRLRSLTAQQQDLQRSFNQFLRQPEVQSALEQRRHRNYRTGLEPTDFATVQDRLAEMEGAALLYPLVLEDRLELLLVTADAPPLRRTVAVSRAELEQAVVEFRQNLETAQGEPIAPAQQLYGWLVAPFEAELAQAEAKVVLLSSDGALRNIPFAALHDGEQWLVERFAFNRVNAKSLQDLGADSLETLQLLIGGVSETQFEGTVGGRDIKLNDLPGVVQEVEAITTLMPDATVLMNDELSEVELLMQVGGHNVVHLATHTLFLPDSPQESFLLLGNDEIVTLEDLQNWNLADVDLLVLSGGETALDSTLDDGTGLLGFTYLMQQAGVETVIAALWNFSDNDPAELMPEFYQALTTGYSPAEALQQAQIAMIQETAEPDVRQLKGAVLNVIDPGTEQPSLRGFAHPYHWAAFVLTGNGL